MKTFWQTAFRAATCALCVWSATLPVAAAPNEEPNAPPVAPGETTNAPAKTPYRQALEASANAPLLIFAPDKVWALQVTSGARLTVERGDIAINSSHQNALWIANASVRAERGTLSVVGGVNALGEVEISPEPRTGTQAINDPFPAFDVPTPPVVSRSKLFLRGADVTMRPGTYVNGVFAGAGVQRITMEPGVYYLDGGDFFVSGASVQGEGVTIVLTGERPGALWTAANAQLNLSAPKDGPLEGLLVIAAPNQTQSVRLTNTQATLDGTIYAPGSGIAVSGQSTVTLTRLLCGDLSLTLNATLQLTGADVPPPDATQPEPPREPLAK